MPKVLFGPFRWHKSFSAFSRTVGLLVHLSRFGCKRCTLPNTSLNRYSFPGIHVSSFCKTSGDYFCKLNIDYVVFRGSEGNMIIKLIFSFRRTFYSQACTLKKKFYPYSCALPSSHKMFPIHESSAFQMFICYVYKLLITFFSF